MGDPFFYSAINYQELIYSFSIKNNQLPDMINLSDGYSPQEDTPKFKPGEIIEHLKYGYRGVIVEFDFTCQASADWYQSNHTQPDRNQPWYHILVDGSQQVTYAAQSNLKYDSSGEPVVHGMINLFFSGYDQENNQYIRNNTPWNPGKPPDAPSTPPPDFTPPPPPTSI
jgi:heat shock protein HspQ